MERVKVDNDYTEVAADFAHNTAPRRAMRLPERLPRSVIGGGLRMAWATAPPGPSPALADDASADLAARAEGGDPPERLRILHVAEAFGGGLFEVLRLLSEGLVDRGHRVAIAFGVRPETPSDLARRLDSRVELIPTAWVQRSASAQLRAARQLRRVTAKWHPDLIHVHSSFAGVVGVTALARSAPTIYTPHGYSFEMRGRPLPLSAGFRLMEAYVGRRVSLVGAVCAHEAELARRALHAPRVAVVHNGIPELDVAVSARKRHRRPLTVGVGRLSPQRQPDACARILAGIADLTDTRWVGGAGKGSSQAAGLLQAGVPITGWTTREDVLAQLREADVYVHWTAWDGLPLSVLEAMACDVLVIAHDIPALRELLDPRQLCTTETEAIALVRRALTEPEVMEDLLTGQRTRASCYGARRMVDEWEDIYGRLTAWRVH